MARGISTSYSSFSVSMRFAYCAQGLSPLRTLRGILVGLPRTVLQAWEPLLLSLDFLGHRDTRVRFALLSAQPSSGRVFNSNYDLMTPADGFRQREGGCAALAAPVE